MNAQQEMTLKQWMAQLPKHHLANRELAELERELAAAKRDAFIAGVEAMKKEAAATASKKLTFYMEQGLFDHDKMGQVESAILALDATKLKEGV
jgi:hypothetical protein